MTALSTDLTASSTLVERVQTAIASSPHLNQRDIRIETEHGQVSLAGDVETFFEKQIAQEVARRVDGVEQIVNHLEVSWR